MRTDGRRRRRRRRKRELSIWHNNNNNKGRWKCRLNQERLRLRARTRTCCRVLQYVCVFQPFWVAAAAVVVTAGPMTVPLSSAGGSQLSSSAFSAVGRARSFIRLAAGKNNSRLLKPPSNAHVCSIHICMPFPPPRDVQPRVKATPAAAYTYECLLISPSAAKPAYLALRPPL